MAVPGRWLRLAFHVAVLRPLLRLVFGVGVEGREHLDGLGQFILVSNHNSHLDALLLYSILPRERLLDTHPVAARDYFGKSSAVFTLMNRLLDPVWVDREGGGGDSLRAMEARLDAGESLILFPEGTRGEPGMLAPFRRGIERLAADRPQVPVVPVFILGPERSFPRSAPVPVPLWNHLVVGPPRIAGTEHPVSAEALRESIEELGRSETAHRHRREPRPETATVAVAGIDGSGKSTLARALALELSRDAEICLIADVLALYARGKPRPLQPLMTERIRVWLGRKAKRAQSLKGYKLPKLTEMLLRDRLLGESRRWYRPAWTILDGIPLVNLTAWSVLYRPELLDGTFCAAALRALTGSSPQPGDRALLDRLPELRALSRLGLAHLQAPRVLIFLDVLPDTAVARIAARGEARQVHETVEKLAALRQAYTLVCETAERECGVRYLRIDGGMSQERVAAEALDFLRSEAEVRHEP